MKKTLIAVAAAAALASTSAFAEITFGTWVRTVAAPVASDGDETYAGLENSWGGSRVARVDITGVTEDGMAGFIGGVYWDVTTDTGNVHYNDEQMWDAYAGLSDNVLTWIKPWDWLQISVGKFDGSYSGERGDFCYGSWNWIRPNNWFEGDEGLTFSGLWRSGLMVELRPVDGLHIYADVPMKASISTTAEDTYRNTQVGASYAIDGIGKIKAQWIGDYKEDTNDGQVEVAFDLTAVENLYVTVGGKFRIADEDNAPNDMKIYVAGGVSYQFTDAFKLSVSGGVKTFQDSDNDTQIQAGAGVDYVIMDGLTAVADVRFLNTGYGDDGDESAVSFLVGLDKNVGSSAILGVGFQGSTNGCGLQGLAGHETDFAWAIPVKVQVGF